MSFHPVIYLYGQNLSGSKIRKETGIVLSDVHERYDVCKKSKKNFGYGSGVIRCEKCRSEKAIVKVIDKYKKIIENENIRDSIDHAHFTLIATALQNGTEIEGKYLKMITDYFDEFSIVILQEDSDPDNRLVLI